MNEAHQRFHNWLSAGADGDPPRDMAVHASVCSECRQSIAALDLLALVNPGMATMPAEPTGRERGRLAMAGRLVGATAVLFSAAILGVGVSQLIGVSRTDNGPVAQANPTPDQNVLGETATPQPSPGPTTAPPRETLTPLATPGPTAIPLPAATAFPYWTFIPTPFPTPVATAPPPSPSGLPSGTPMPSGSQAPSPTAIPTPVPTPIPTAIPTATPVPTATPLPQCSDGVDNDGDSLTDFGFDLECTDLLDNDEAIL